MPLEGARGSKPKQPTGGAVSAPPAAAPVNERRVAPRAPVDRPVEIRLLDITGAPEAKTIAARLADLSASGVGLRVARPIAPGKQFLLAPPAGAAGAAGAAAPIPSLVYRVVRCKPLGGGQFHVGASFVRHPAGRAPTPGKN